MTRRIALLAVTVAVLALGAAEVAGAADECRGLQTCLPVTGPWVVLPAPARGAAATVVWVMRCPLRGYIVAGVDARVSDRAIDVSIRGENGAPVSPGVTTGPAVAFTAVYTGGAPKQTSFQPYVGCVPTSGGGGRAETAFRRLSAFRPVKALDRRVVRKRLVSGATVKVSGGCPPGTRLLGSSHAYAFGTPAEPGPTLLHAVTVRSVVAGRRVVATATVAPSVPRSVPVMLQLHSLCSRGTR